jgi:glycosyltransferase involved in cell wall biosynthesis
MRILYHHRTLGDGAEGIHVASMVEAFRRLGHEVQVVAMIGERTNVPSARTRRLDRLVRVTPRALYEAMEVGYSVPAYYALMAHIRSWRPDVLYERYALFNLAGVAAARRAAIPIVLEVNAPLAWERAHYERLSLRRLATRCERLACAHADLVEVVSTPLKSHLVELGVPADRIAVVPNAADPSIFRPDPAARSAVRRALRIAEDRVVIGFAGILRAWHGVELVVEAVSRLGPRAPVQLLLVGDGPSRRDIETFARTRGLEEQVTITGRVAHGEIPRHLAAFDIAVSPRATFYASPMKVPEYMAVGLPVVAPRMPNLADLIVDGQDGVLFAPEDPAALATALSRLICDSGTRARIGRAARDRIARGRTWEHNAATVLDSLAELRQCA